MRRAEASSRKERLVSRLPTPNGPELPIQHHLGSTPEWKAQVCSRSPDERTGCPRPSNQLALLLDAGERDPRLRRGRVESGSARPSATAQAAAIQGRHGTAHKRNGPSVFDSLCACQPGADFVRYAGAGSRGTVCQRLRWQGRGLQHGVLHCNISCCVAVNLWLRRQGLPETAVLSPAQRSECAPRCLARTECLRSAAQHVAMRQSLSQHSSSTCVESSHVERTGRYRHMFCALDQRGTGTAPPAPPSTAEYA